jgi:hypothetical protein
MGDEAIAAGNLSGRLSPRMGTFKPLMHYLGAKTLLEHCATNALKDIIKKSTDPC